MLSIAAFNALLKTLEEPPAHLIFILATTELHKVPATILSRCQRFAFKRIRPQDIAQRLQYVAGQEQIALTADAAELLSRLADGALRDALSLLDQCGAAGGTVDANRVLDVLGLAGNAQSAQLLSCVLRRDAPGALLLLDKLYNGGKDVSALLGELSTLVRDLLIRATAPEGGASLLSGGYDASVMDGLLAGVPPARLLFMASLLQSTLAALPLSANRRTDAELCLLRLCDEGLCGDVTALAARLARLEDAGVSAAPAPAPAPCPPPWDEPAPAARNPVPDEPPPFDDGPPPYGEPVAPPAKRQAPPPQPSPRSTPPRPEPPKAVPDSNGLWGTLVEQCRGQLSPMYQSLLDDAAGRLEGDTLVVYCGDELTRDGLNRAEIRELFANAAAQRLQRPIGVRFVLGKDGAPAVDRLDELIRRGSGMEGFVVKP